MVPPRPPGFPACQMREEDTKSYIPAGGTTLNCPSENGLWLYRGENLTERHGDRFATLPLKAGRA